jgi:hypothetical protein
MAPAAKLFLDVLDRYGDPCRKTLEDGHEGASVGLSRGEIAKGHALILAPGSSTTSAGNGSGALLQDLFALTERELVVPEEHRGALPGCGDELEVVGEDLALGHGVDGVIDLDLGAGRALV